MATNTRRVHVISRALFLISFVVFLFALDALVFRFLIWKIPNETAWESEPLYNFEYHLRKLENDKADNEFRVLVIGSSIATYSVLPERLEKKLRSFKMIPEIKDNLRVRLSAHQGATTMNMLASIDRFIKSEPDIVVLPLNMVDFRLERPIVLRLMNRLKGKGRGNALIEIERDLLVRSEFRMFSPAGLLKRYRDSLNLDERAGALLAWMFCSFRYRGIAKIPVQKFFSNRFSRGHSYLHYAGIPVGLDNVTYRGRTGKYFRIKITRPLIEKGLEIQAPKELFVTDPDIKNNELPSLKIRIFRSGSRADCTFKSSQGLLKEWSVNLRRGWQNIDIPEQTGYGGILCGELNRLYYSEIKGTGLGLRLARNTGLYPPQDKSLQREIRREDLLYKNYTDEQYRQSFNKRILRFNRAGMEYLHSLMLAKQQWGAQSFDEGLPTMRAFARLRASFQKAGIPLIVINSPENPLSLKWYERSRWYNDFMKFLARSDNNYYFYDSHNIMTVQYFSDYHHLTYFGAERFTDILAGQIRDVLKFSKKATRR